MLSVDAVARLQEYGIVNLHVLVEPVPVAARLALSAQKTGLVVWASKTETSVEQLTFVMPVVLIVIVRVTVIVPVTVTDAGNSASSSVTIGTG
jgi:hypothetical protein